MPHAESPPWSPPPDPAPQLPRGAQACGTRQRGGGPLQVRPPQALWGASAAFEVVLTPPPSLQRAGPPSITPFQAQSRGGQKAKRARVPGRDTRGATRGRVHSAGPHRSHPLPGPEGLPQTAAGSPADPRGELSAPAGSAVTPGHEGGWAPGESQSHPHLPRGRVCCRRARGQRGGHPEMPPALPSSAGPQQDTRQYDTRVPRPPTTLVSLKSSLRHQRENKPRPPHPPTTLSTQSGVAR